MEKAIAYIRVSTEEQAEEGVSLAVCDAWPGWIGWQRRCPGPGGEGYGGKRNDPFPHGEDPPADPSTHPPLIT